jgi:hypothetical protein
MHNNKLELEMMYIELNKNHTKKLEELINITKQMGIITDQYAAKYTDNNFNDAIYHLEQMKNIEIQNAQALAEVIGVR